MQTALAPLFLIISATSFAHPLMIREPAVNEDCNKSSRIKVVEENGEYYIKAFFNGSMNAIVDGTKNYQKRRCTLDFKVSVAPNFQIDSFEFAVDGVYNLSQNGTARLTVSHRIANLPAIRQTAFFSQLNGAAPAAGDITHFVGSISGDKLEKYNSCGASRIPLETSVYVTATQPVGEAGLTQIDLDEGHSSINGYTLCRVRVKPCR